MEDVAERFPTGFVPAMHAPRLVSCPPCMPPGWFCVHHACPQAGFVSIGYACDAGPPWTPFDYKGRSRHGDLIACWARFRARVVIRVGGHGRGQNQM